ncbi:hypothetical protein Hanom_Chr03g00230081 [Helianthus anomalus]
MNILDLPSFADNYKISGEDELKKTFEEENEDNDGGDEGFIIRDEEYKAKVKPLNLSRCKSEPTRTWDKFFVQFCL